MLLILVFDNVRMRLNFQRWVQVCLYETRKITPQCQCPYREHVIVSRVVTGFLHACCWDKCGIRALWSWWPYQYYVVCEGFKMLPIQRKGFINWRSSALGQYLWWPAIGVELVLSLCRPTVKLLSVLPPSSPVNQSGRPALFCSTDWPGSGSSK